ncbi:MAG: hypothetical protein FWH07_00055 [Oscillospiraceae bacterium]|nr:hypothetical protein [Oscillospiraceae bacterium]
MALSKNEQIALYVVIFLVIAVAGGILFLMPEYNKIEENRNMLNTRKAEYARLEEELGLEKFENVEKSIIAAYEDGRGASAAFYDNEMSSYEADRLIRDVLRGVNLDTNNLVVNPLTTHSLVMSIFRDIDITYGIKDMATIGSAEDMVSEGGDVVAETSAEGETVAEPTATTAPVSAAVPDEDAGDLDAMMAFMMNAPRVQALDFFEQNITNQARAAYVVTAMREFLANESETVAVQSVRFEMLMTRQEAFALSMHVYNLNNASYITSMTNQEFNSSSTVNADGEVVAADGGGRRVYTVDMMFFIVEPMEEPNFDYANRFNWEAVIIN